MFHTQITLSPPHACALVMELLCSCDPEEITAKDNHPQSGNQVLRFLFPSTSNCKLISFNCNLGSLCYPESPILDVSIVIYLFEKKQWVFFYTKQKLCRNTQCEKVVNCYSTFLLSLHLSVKVSILFT